MPITATAISPELAGAVLEIDLDAIAANYRLLRDKAHPAACAGVVKADAYGCGVDRVAPALFEAGCRCFFVAHLSEGEALRPILPEAEIYVLNGLAPGQESSFDKSGLLPVLNDLGQIDRWAEHGRDSGGRKAIVQVDTGMNRLGLPGDEIEVLAQAPERLQGLDVSYFASHLASADDHLSAQNKSQLARFQSVLARLPERPASLANSSGIFLGSAYHFDLVRPGVALYGSNPTPQAENPMREVVHLSGKIYQLRDIDRPETVGYGASYAAPGRRRIATVPVGYGDGYLRSIGNRGYGILAGTRVPVVGRVSMDLITLDVSDAPAAAVYPGADVSLIGGGVNIDELGKLAGSMAYELLTSLGRRYARVYNHVSGGAK